MGRPPTIRKSGIKPLPQRRSTRLRGYDYSEAGAYFVTICCYRQTHYFGQILDGEMHLSAQGTIAANCWMELPQHFPSIELDAWVIMPNHVHGIVFNFGVDHQSTTLGAIIGQFKSSVTRKIHGRIQNEHVPQIWQRNYHDHIIRGESDLRRIREYVANNPIRWGSDLYYTV